MVQVDISAQTHVQANNCAGVATLLNHPPLEDSMMVDESSTLCDDAEINITPLEMVHGGTGGTGGTSIRNNASSQASGPVPKKVDTNTA